MSFQEIVNIAKIHFPKLKIKFKNDYKIMSLLKYILFFNVGFMNFTTIIGYTIFFPNIEYIIQRKENAYTILIHELVHIYDMENMGKFGHIFFSIKYLFPQILFLLIIPILFFSWKIALCFCIFLIPFPAYWRMKYEKRAYMVSMYVQNYLQNKLKKDFLLESNKNYFIRQFLGSNYYFMWIFPNIRKEFNESLAIIKMGGRPFKDEKLFNMIDEIIKAV